MNLDKYLMDFETNFNEDLKGISLSTGKIDNNAEKAICFYNSKRNQAYNARVGGKKNKSTNIKPITILLRFTKNQDNAETMAQKIYDFYCERSFFIDEKRIYTEMLYDEPVSLGTDDSGIFEYSFELNFYEGGK
jgi:hypothetical protein